MSRDRLTRLFLHAIARRPAHALVAACALLVLTGCGRQIDPPPRWPVEFEPRRVFAHYMVCCPAAGPDAGAGELARDILAAREAGLDGFALNAGSWEREPKYRETMLALYRAAASVAPEFALFPSADFCCGLTDDEVVDVMRTFYDHPNQFRFEGRPLLSTFAGGENLRTIADRLKAEGRPIAVVPYVFPLPADEHPGRREIGQVFARMEWADGFFFFAGPGTPEENARANARLAVQWLGAGKVFMAGITPYYRGLGGNYRVFESHGFEGMAAQWENVIRLRIPWVEIVTWNDWGEASYVAPFGPPAATDLWNGHWGPTPSHQGFLGASRYYVSWFKAGAPPPILRDRIFYFYRPHERSVAGPGTPGGETRARPRGAGRLRDRIYVTAMLASPARLQVSCGGTTTTFDLASGVHHVRAPLTPGRPHFLLERAGTTVLEKTAEHAISAAGAWANFNPFAGSASAPAGP